MASGSATPPAEDPPEPGSGEPPDDPTSEPMGGGERYGPLAVRRTRKDDGRALILYSDARPGRSEIDDAAGNPPEPAA
jgi:hypothetical protein